MTPILPGVREADVLSAGVLFFSIPPNDHNIYFLLGMDAFDGKWSDFGGKREEQETFVQCAVRESWEESMGLVDLGPSVNAGLISSKATTTTTTALPFSTVSECSRLGHKKRSRSVPDRFVFRQQRGGGRYMPALNRNNHNKSSSAHSSSSSSACSSLSPLLPSTLDQLQWATHMRSLLMSKQYTFAAAINVASTNINTNTNTNSAAAGSSFADSSPKWRVCFLQHVPWQPHLPRTFAKTHQFLKSLSNQTGEAAIQLYRALPTSLHFHPAIRVKRNKNDEIVAIRVKKEWLEKQGMCWWSIPRLRQIMRNGGKYKHHAFRWRFLSTLSVFLDHIARIQHKPNMFPQSEPVACGSIFSKVPRNSSQQQTHFFIRSSTTAKEAKTDSNEDTHPEDETGAKEVEAGADSSRAGGSIPMPTSPQNSEPVMVEYIADSDADKTDSNEDEHENEQNCKKSKELHCLPYADMCMLSVFAKHQPLTFLCSSYDWNENIAPVT